MKTILSAIKLLNSAKLARVLAGAQSLTEEEQAELLEKLLELPELRQAIETHDTGKIYERVERLCR